MHLATITEIWISIIYVNEKKGIRRTSPITAKGNIEDDIMLLEVLCDVVKVPSREHGIGSTPRIGVRGSLVDIVRNGLVSEEPSFDRLFVQNVGVNTALFMLTPCP